jgi:hypothetical protein
MDRRQRNMRIRLTGPAFVLTMLRMGWVPRMGTFAALAATQNYDA